MREYEVIVQDSQTKVMHDITDIVFEPEIINDLGSPDEFKFSIIDDKLPLNEGSIVRFKYHNLIMFYGYIFSKSYSEKKTIEVKAYNQMRYLKNKDSMVFPSQTVNERFEQICKLCGLKYAIYTKTYYKLPPEVCDDKTYWEMIESAIDKTLIGKGEMFIVREMNGILVLIEVSKLRTNYVIGDDSLALEYEFETSIEDDTFNTVKLVKDNDKTKKREVYIVKDSSTIAKWGKLQYFEKVNDKMTPQQIQERANNIIKIKNRVTKSLKVNCIGVDGIGVGSGVIISLKRLKDLGVKYEGYYIVTKCTHNFDKQHTMELELNMGV